MDAATRKAFWISGIEQRGANVHPAERAIVTLGADPREEYARLRAGEPPTAQRRRRATSGKRAAPIQWPAR